MKRTWRREFTTYHCNFFLCVVMILIFSTILFCIYVLISFMIFQANLSPDITLLYHGNYVARHATALHSLINIIRPDNTLR